MWKPFTSSNSFFHTQTVNGSLTLQLLGNMNKKAALKNYNADESCTQY